MSNMTMNLLWCVLQVSVVCAVATIASMLISRWYSSSHGRISQAALLVVLCLTALSTSPWPSWTNTPEITVIEAQPGLPTETASTGLAGTDQGRSQAHAPVVSPGLIQRSLVQLNLLTLTLVEHLGHLAAWVVALIGLSVFIGACRFVIGWRTVMMIGRSAQTISDSSVLNTLKQLQHQLGCTRQVSIGETSDMTTPATIGWLRPQILLPRGWKTWTPNEIHTVLAHELAHIKHNDFSSLALAQISTIFHFYHPLVHGLVARLRFEQELAADDAAADVSGGRDRYLKVLATMALRHEDHSIAWPARPFLATSGTFLRRIEMLRDSRQSGKRKFGAGRIAAIVLVLAGGILVSGLRPNTTTAQDGAIPKGIQQSDKKINERRVESMNHLKSLGLAMHNYHSAHKRFPAAATKAGNSIQHSWRVALLPFIGLESLYEQYHLDEPWDSDHNKKLLEKIPDVYRAPGAAKDSPNTSYFVLTGKGTPFGKAKGTPIKKFKDGTSNTLLIVESKKSVPWTKPVDIAYAKNKPLPKLGGLHENGFMICLADGAAMFVSDKVTKQVLRNLITMSDGNRIHTDQLRIKE